MHRVVVTGLGIIAPNGNSVKESWENVLSGKSAVRHISLFDTSELPVQIGAEVRQFDAEDYMGPKEARKASRFIQFAIAASKQAIEDSQLGGHISSDRFGCIFGVGLGASDEFETQSRILATDGPRKVSPMLMPTVIPNMAAGFIALQHKMRGVNMCVSTACASGTHSIGEAYMHVAMGTADGIVAGASESVFTPLIFAAFARMGALSCRNDSPATASRPFDAERDGFVIGEGAAALVLESLEHARNRGAHIYAEVSGYGATADAFHITSPPPEGDGAARAMSCALKSAGLRVEDIDYINAHGSSTKLNDAAESAAIETVFGEHARNLAVSSTKGATGHCLGAAGAIEAVLTVKAIEDHIIPPTANLNTPDSSCRLNYTPKAAQRRDIRHALSNSFGFGGQNACIAFSAPDSTCA